MHLRGHEPIGIPELPSGIEGFDELLSLGPTPRPAWFFRKALSGDGHGPGSRKRIGPWVEPFQGAVVVLEVVVLEVVLVDVRLVDVTLVLVSEVDVLVREVVERVHVLEPGSGRIEDPGRGPVHRKKKACNTLQPPTTAHEEPREL